MLLLVAIGLIGLFVIAGRVSPYDDAGRPLTFGTHMRLGMPPCEFYVMSGKPCPSCGMTTSFALLMRGDIGASLRANAVGTLLAGFFGAMVPWCLLVALRGRYLWVQSIERASLWVGGAFLVLLLIRWGIVLLL